MKTFKYEAMSASGSRVQGIIEAYDRTEAIAKVRDEGQVVVKIQEQKASAFGSGANGKVTAKNLSLMCSQFKIILKAGLPLVRTVELVAGQTSDKTLKAILTEVSHDIQAGHTLADSFADRGKTIPVTFIETIRAGEKSGNLETAFERLEVYYDKTYKTSSAVKGAMTYPAIIVVVMIAAIIIVNVVAVPMFKDTFAQLGGELPLPTKILIGVSDFMTQKWVVCLGLVAFVVLAFKFWSSSDKGGKQLALLALKAPLLGRINTLNAANEFATTLTTMMSSGLPLVEAITITGKVIKNRLISQAVQGLAVGLESGRRLGDCIREVEYFPDLLIEMTAVGEETGSIESTLTVVADYFDQEVNAAVAALLSAIEPIMIVVIAVFVCFVLLSIYLPMFSMYDSV